MMNGKAMMNDDVWKGTFDNGQVFCVACDKAIKKNHWNQHKKTVHSSKLYSCSICPNRTFKAMRYLKRHMRKLHQPELMDRIDEGIVELKVNLNLEDNNNSQCRQQKKVTKHAGDEEISEKEVLLDCNPCNKSSLSSTDLEGHGQKAQVEKQQT